MPRLWFLVCIVLVGTCVRAQRVLLFERSQRDRSERLYEGDELVFKLEGDDFWQRGIMRELRPDIQAIVINDRYILLDEIAVVRRGSTLAAVAGTGLMTFGAGWLFFAAVGYNIDRDPDTQIGRGDVILGLSNLAVGYGLLKLLGTKKFRPGRGRRLRIIDTSF